MKLSRRQDKVLRFAARIVFGWCAVAGALGSLMCLVMGQFVGAAIFAGASAVGVCGWKLAARSLPDGFASLGQLRDRLEARINGTPYTDPTKNDKH